MVIKAHDKSIRIRSSLFEVWKHEKEDRLKHEPELKKYRKQGPNGHRKTARTVTAKQRSPQNSRAGVRAGQAALFGINLGAGDKNVRDALGQAVWGLVCGGVAQPVKIQQD